MIEITAALFSLVKSRMLFSHRLDLKNRSHMSGAPWRANRKTESINIRERGSARSEPLFLILFLPKNGTGTDIHRVKRGDRHMKTIDEQVISILLKSVFEKGYITEATYRRSLDTLSSTQPHRYHYLQETISREVQNGYSCGQRQDSIG